MKNLFIFVLVTFMFVLPFSTLAQTPCLNTDFEASLAGIVTSSNQVTGWLCASANQSVGSTNCNMTICCGSNPQTSMLISAASGHTDNVIGAVYPIYSVFGTSTADANAAIVNPQIGFPMKGSNVFRLGSSSTAPRLERISKTFTITPTDHILDVAFISVLAKGHDCCYGAMFKVTINSFTCPLIFASAAAPGSCADMNKGITFYAPFSGTLASSLNSPVFSKWDIRRLDLGAFVGQTVTVNFTSASCVTSGHFGYAYIDTQCGAAMLTVNQTTVPLIAGTTSISACGGDATVTAPPYFDSYLWQGPQGFSATSAAIVTSVTGTYTLNLSDSLSCNPTSHVVVLLPPPTVSITTAKATSCAGNPVVLTASGVSNYTWQNGANSVSITISPTVTSTYTLTGTDLFGCSATQSITQNVTACTGLHDSYTLENNIRIYPNPNQKDFIIQIPALTNGVLILENSIGQKVFQQNIFEGENRIKTAGLAAGLYYYKIMSVETEIKHGKLKLE